MWPCSPDPIKSQINPSHALPSNLRRSLILFSHLRRGLTSRLFPPVFPTKTVNVISLPPPPNYTFYFGQQTLIHQYQCYTLFNASKGSYCSLSSRNNFWHFLCLRCPTQRTDTLWYQMSDIRLFPIQNYKIQSILPLKFRNSTRFYTFKNYVQHNATAHEWCCYSIMRLCSVQQWRTQEFYSGEGSTNSVEDRRQRERGSGGGSPLVRGSGSSCNFIQEISFHIVRFS